MDRLFSRRLLAGVLVVALCLVLGPAARAADLARSAEAQALGVEALFQQLLDSNQVRPVFADLGGGFHSMSISLPPEAVGRLAEAAQVDADGVARKGQSFVVLATGLQLTAPTNPSTLIHAALSSTDLPYNYWVITLNLGSQDLTRKTTLVLSGPKKFNKSVVVNYGANGIWAVWYNPAVGVGTPGVYTLKATVDGGGSATTKSFAVNP
jgi:hypothetical protein